MTTEIAEQELVDARQIWGDALIAISKAFEEEGVNAARVVANGALDTAYGFEPVSYTHLTLPTTVIV